MIRDEIQAIAKEIVIWLSEEGLSIDQISEVLKTVKNQLSDFFNNCKLDVSSLLMDTKIQHLSVESNHAHLSEQESPVSSSNSGYLSSLTLVDRFPALCKGQNPIKQDTSSKDEKSMLMTAEEYAQQIKEIFIEFHLSINEVHNILERIRYLLRDLPLRKNISTMERQG
ncbi:MAG: hypothetical protein A2077_01405 [Nitrospirae bacterium GWC2_46_6]|nr:MAG: hypothetical protein A2077_01405 [Nitrospirae bacterium GWC2_46_6]OGW23059.1 MAG: hypothetical protein A2X55_08785 [Nitrospirae bacterium GWB2_47_37]HAK87606.1 hypothetical protein [Nitrospiraceae bacterium]